MFRFLRIRPLQCPTCRQMPLPTLFLLDLSCRLILICRQITLRSLILRLCSLAHNLIQLCSPSFLPIFEPSSHHSTRQMPPRYTSRSLTRHPFWRVHHCFHLSHSTNLNPSLRSPHRSLLMSPRSLPPTSHNKLALLLVCTGCCLTTVQFLFIMNALALHVIWQLKQRAIQARIPRQRRVLCRESSMDT